MRNLPLPIVLVAVLLVFLDVVGAATTVPATTAPADEIHVGFWILIGIAGLMLLIVLGILTWWCFFPMYHRYGYGGPTHDYDFERLLQELRKREI